MYIQSKKARLLGLKLGLFDTQCESSKDDVYLLPKAGGYHYARNYKREGPMLVTDRLLPPRVTPITDGGCTMITIPHGYCLPENIQDKDPRYGRWSIVGTHIQRSVIWTLHPRVKMFGLQLRGDSRILVVHAIVDGRCLEHWKFGTNVFIEDDF